MLFLSTDKESFYEELSKVQKLEMDKREKEFSKNEMVQVATKKAEEEAKKRYLFICLLLSEYNLKLIDLYFSYFKIRKSKWDQPAPSAVAMQQASVIKSSGLITTSITGTKGTVISAFGSLPKKSKP